MKFKRGRFIFGMIMILLMSLMMTAMPVMAIAAESGPLEIVSQSGPVAVDSLVHKVGQLGIGGWIQFAVIVWGIFLFMKKQWREEVRTGHMSRWDFIKQAIPYVHGQAQKAKGINKTIDKAVSFVEYMNVLLRSAQLPLVQVYEHEAIKALGSGYHQEFKMVRDAGEISPLVLNVPLKAGSASDPSLKPLPDGASVQNE